MTPRHKSVICGLGGERKKHIYWYNYRKTSWGDSWGVYDLSRRILRYLASTAVLRLPQVSLQSHLPRWEKSNCERLKLRAPSCGVLSLLSLTGNLENLSWPGVGWKLVGMQPGEPCHVPCLGMDILPFHPSVGTQFTQSQDLAQDNSSENCTRWDAQSVPGLKCFSPYKKALGEQL